MNLAAFRDVTGVAQAAALSALGATVTVVVGGWHWMPQTSLVVTGLSMVSLAAYLLMFARGAHTRALKLNETRRQLRQSQQTLQGQLAEIQALQAQLTDQANRDPLTGLFNRRYLNDTVQRDFDRCARAAEPLSVLLIDIDHFKLVNDRHGHGAGDRVLQAVAVLLQQQVRSSDVICRYGGEEFLVLLPGMSASAALDRAEHYREQVQSLWVPETPGLGPLSLSVGVACNSDGAPTPAQLIDQADQALYQAKAAGRNRCLRYVPQANGCSA